MTGFADKVRQRLSEDIAWPMGDVPFAVEELLEWHRLSQSSELERQEIVNTLSAYYDSLDIDTRKRVAPKLIARLLGVALLDVK